ncbi:MAG: DUF802 domain-containing protein [Burkholderiaceae bacterium]
MNSNHLIRKLTWAPWVAFALGLAAVLWVGAGFVGSNPIALSMMVAIAATYLLGAMEIRRYQGLTGGLSAALAKVPTPLAQLADWLPSVPDPLQHAVRQRIEGERAALPGLSLTPYLIGLLVMLGMLGTFLGMVVTFKGAVFALEGSADLQAIRAALAAPIKGLGFAFGTSVAGVATSAMLGLMSALVRRDRLEVVRRLDVGIATVFHPFTLAHQRNASFAAMQAQAGALPAVVDQLQALMTQLEQRSQQLDAQLQSRQEVFHKEAAVAYQGLGQSVARSLQDSLTASARMAGETIQPVVVSAMKAIAEESTRLHAQVGESVQLQLNGLSEQFSTTSRAITEQWNQALENQSTAQGELVGGLGQALKGFNQTFEQRSEALLAQMVDAMGQQLREQLQAEQAKQSAWVHTLQTQAQASGDLVRRLDETLVGFNASFEHRAHALLDEVVAAMGRGQAEQVQAEQQRLGEWRQSLQAVAADLQNEWQTMGRQNLAQHEEVAASLAEAATSIRQSAAEQARQTQENMARLLDSSEALVKSRHEAESQWAAQQGERMDQLAALWRSELAALRAQEQARGENAQTRMADWQEGLTAQLQTLRREEDLRAEAAVGRLGELQAAMATHLATLGDALEAPMSRLLATASEAPKAAAEVIGQLRHEMSHLTERDNQALQERMALMERLGSLLHSVEHATGAQRAAIETLVGSATGVLDQVSQQFRATLEAQAASTNEAADRVAGSAADLASLGEAFQHGVGLFSESNQKLVDKLQGVEGAIAQNMARSDEQLAYYVAQAREVIDLSISAQQGIVEDLRRLRSNAKAQAAGSAA